MLSKKDPNQLSVHSIIEIKPEVWHVNRKLDFKPPHFVTANTAITRESAKWIVHTLSGRYTFIGSESIDDFFVPITLPSFEDPTEALLYELKWS
jgi:hypothetical protein